jgi:hypothetical protein
MIFKNRKATSRGLDKSRARQIRDAGLQFQMKSDFNRNGGLSLAGYPGLGHLMIRHFRNYSVIPDDAKKEAGARCTPAQQCQPH